MDELLDIREVVRRTGLTSRALRFYEARGLLAPLRTNSGRRLYGAAALERLNQILALKRAGLTLAQIERLSARAPIDLARLIDAQIEAIEAQARGLEEARALLRAVKSRIDRGEPVDVATFCSLIRQGDKVMEQENWKAVADRYFSPEAQAHWAERREALPAG
jgi:MerR family transcriptional regulator, thiopeptide resistance regulator